MRTPKSRHPGGINLTERAVRLAQLAPGMRVLDVGCGDGVTVELLRAQRIDAIGVDIAPYNPEKHDYILRANAMTLPFADGEFDAIIYECCLSIMPDAIAALREAERILKPRGILIMSDVVSKKMAPGMPWITDDIRKILKWAGFGIEISEDHTPALITYAAEAIENCSYDGCGGADGLEDICNGVDARKLGYCLVIARRYQ